MLNRAVVGLGLTQIVGWGTTYYAPAVLAAPMAADTGWSLTLVFAAFSWSMLVAGVVSRRLGGLIDRHGARVVMSSGSVGVACGLALLASARHPVQLFAAWTVLGVSMRAVLYDAAFVAIAAVAGPEARRAISLLTLLGGLASTVFWPIGHALGGALGWRATFWIYAALQVAVCLPLHLWVTGPRRAGPAPAAGDGHGADGHGTTSADAPAGSPGDAPAGAPAGSPADPPADAPADPPADAAADSAAGRPPAAARDRAIAILAALLAANSFVFASMSAHLIAVMQGLGLAAGLAVAIASIKGVAQVAARMVELAAQRWLGPIAVGVIATGLLPGALVLLWVAAPHASLVLAAMLVYGASNGLVTIVRGAVPLALFGPRGYGAVLGRIAAPGLVVGALAPTLFAWVLERHGARAGIVLLMAAAGLSFAGMLWLARRIQYFSPRKT